MDTQPSPDNDPDNREKLAALYPTPKSYDELQADRERLNILNKSREPKLPLVRVVVELAALVVFFTLITAIVPVIVLSNPLAGVCISILLCLMWFGLVWAHAHRSSGAFQRMQLPYGLFIVGNLFSLLPMIALSYKVLEGLELNTPFVMSVVAGVSQLVVASLILGLLANKKAPNSAKIAGIGLMPVVFIAMIFLI